MADLLSIGLSGLRASQTSLSTTGHNISNVNTPGFSRQQTLQATQLAQFNGAGYIGSGTTVTDVRRLASEFLSAQVRNTTVVAGDVAAYNGQIEQLDGLLAGTVTGINPSLQSFFAALQTSVESPADGPARQLVLSESEGLAKRFNSVYERLNQQNQFINQQMGSITEQISRLASNVASYNDAIVSARSAGGQPNDLLDAREETLRQLSGLIGIQVIEQDGGAVNVFVGSGQPLVVGKMANSIEVSPSTSDPLRMQVDFVSGSTRQVITNQINGGEIGGLIRYRNEALDPTYNAIGRLALSVSDQVNSQLGQGLDIKGEVGVNLFKDINAPELVSQRSFPTGASVLIEDSTRLTTSDYRLDYDAGVYTVRRLSDNAVIPHTGTGTAADPLQLESEGFSVSFATPPTGSVTLMPTRNGAGAIQKVLDQPEQLAFAAPVRATANLNNAGNAVIGQPQLVDGPSPISKTDLQAVLGASGLSLIFSAPDQLTLSGGSALFQPGASNTFTIVPGQDNTLLIGDGNYSFELTFSGRPAAGDTFSLAQNSNGVSDNRNGLKLVDLQNKAVIGVSYDAGGPIANSGVTFSGGYGDLVERVGTLAAQAKVDGQASGILLKQAQDSRDSLAGVNLDEEAANLIQFEQYYNASAQVIQVARSLFDTLLNIFR